MSKDIIKTGLFLIKKGSEVLNEKQFASVIQMGTILGSVYFAHKTVDKLSDKYDELSIERHSKDGESILIKAKKLKDKFIDV